MKAIVKYAAEPGNMEIREVPEPKAGPGQIKIKVVVPAFAAPTYISMIVILPFQFVRRLRWDMSSLVLSLNWAKV